MPAEPLLLRSATSADAPAVKAIPRETFETGLAKTVAWYLGHADWVGQVKSGEYRTWLETNYGKRQSA